MYFLSGLFTSNTGDISDIFYITITPAGWTFSIWGFIYAWQLLWMIYVLTTLCRRDSNGVYIYQLPLLPPVFFVMFLINNLFIIGWTFLWDRKYVGWAALDIVFTPLTLYACLMISFWKLYKNLQAVRAAGLNKDVWLIRMLVQNGIAFFATWVSIATLLNFAIVMVYKWSVEMETACTVALAILAGDIVVWFVLDMFVLDKFVRYTFSPYIVLVVGLSGSVAKNFDLESNERNSIFSSVLLAAAALLFLVKIVMIIFRHRRYPIKGNVSDDIKGNLA